MANTPTSMSKIYADRYPDAGRTNAWHGEMVHVETNMGLWRPEARGYTDSSAEAWLLPFDVAIAKVETLGPEKDAHFVLPDGHPGIHTTDHVPERKAAPVMPEADAEDQPGF